MNEKEIGTVVSSFEGPSPVELNFVVNSGVVHRGQFIELDYNEGTLIALIVNVIKTNRYFERAESVKEFESKGHNLFEQFPVGEWEYLIAKTKPLGVFKEGVIRRATYPPSPGTKVRLASPMNLKKFLHLDDNGLNLGKVEYHDLEVKLNMTRLLQKHCSILAQSGYGKSFFTADLIEELLDRKKEHGRIAVLVFDLHGEYLSFAEPITNSKYSDYSNKTRVIHSREIKIGVPKLSVQNFASFIPDLSGQQKRELSKIILKLQKEMREGLGPYDLINIKNELLRDEDLNENTSRALISWLNDLEETRLFSSIDSPNILDLIKPGQLAIVDLSDSINLKRKQIIVSYFTSKIFYERRQKSIPPFLIVLEESHNFIPQFSSKEGSISKHVFRTIAREGRKFGASLCLISQRPVQLDTTTLSQCGTNIFLRITNPNDLKHISESAEAIDKNSLDMLTSLRVGEALLVGEAVGNPVFFKVRKRKSMESKHEISLEDSAKRFEESKEESEKETKEFL